MSKPLRILLLEDHCDTACILRRSLQPHGIDVVIATNGPQALELCRAHAFDLLLCDIRLRHEMDGYAFLSALRAGGCHVPAIALTADVFPADVERCLAAGFLAHVGKPVDPEDLVARIDSLLEDAGRQQNEVTPMPPQA